MEKRAKLTTSRRPVPAQAPGNGDLLNVVEGVLHFLNGHQHDRDEGIKALLLAFVQAGVEVLEDSEIEDVEANRNSLLTMLDQARRVLDAQELASARWTVH